MHSRGRVHNRVNSTGEKIMKNIIKREGWGGGGGGGGGHKRASSILDYCSFLSSYIAIK
jgi:hypothetical protein